MTCVGYVETFDLDSEQQDSSDYTIRYTYNNNSNDDGDSRPLESSNHHPYYYIHHSTNQRWPVDTPDFDTFNEHHRQSTPYVQERGEMPRHSLLDLWKPQDCANEIVDERFVDRAERQWHMNAHSNENHGKKLELKKRERDFGAALCESPRMVTQWPENCEFESIDTLDNSKINRVPTSQEFPTSAKRAKTVKKNILKSAPQFYESNMTDVSTTSFGSYATEDYEVASVAGGTTEKPKVTTVRTAALKTKIAPSGKVETSSEAVSSFSLSTKKRHLTSRFKGVCWYKRTKKWVVQVKIQGIRAHVGYFDDEIEAAAAYKKAMDEIVQDYNLGVSIGSGESTTTN